MKNLFFLILFIFSSCGAFQTTTTGEIAQLSKGMTKKEVVKILGEPHSTELIKGAPVWGYDVYSSEFGGDHYSYHLVFGAPSERLSSWYKADKRIIETKN